MDFFFCWLTTLPGSSILHFLRAHKGHAELLVETNLKSYGQWEIGRETDDAKHVLVDIDTSASVGLNLCFGPRTVS